MFIRSGFQFGRKLFWSFSFWKLSENVSWQLVNAFCLPIKCSYSWIDFLNCPCRLDRQISDQCQYAITFCIQATLLTDCSSLWFTHFWRKSHSALLKVPTLWYYKRVTCTFKKGCIIVHDFFLMTEWGNLAIRFWWDILKDTQQWDRSIVKV